MEIADEPPEGRIEMLMMRTEGPSWSADDGDGGSWSWSADDGHRGQIGGKVVSLDLGLLSWSHRGQPTSISAE